MSSTMRMPARTDEESEYYSLNRKVYRLFAPFYDVVTFPLRKMRRDVAVAVELQTGARVLDVATGTGAQAFAFAERAYEVVGIDLSEQMLRIARRKHRFRNVTFHQADATNLPFEAATFDATCISFALHEMPQGIRERTLREMVRVTRAGGTIIIVDYGLPPSRIARSLAYQFIKLYERDHYTSFIRTDLEALLKRSCIDVSESRPALAGLARILIGRRSEASAAMADRPPDAGVAPR